MLYMKYIEVDRLFQDLLIFSAKLHRKFRHALQVTCFVLCMVCVKMQEGTRKLCVTVKSDYFKNESHSWIFFRIC